MTLQVAILFAENLDNIQLNDNQKKIFDKAIKQIEYELRYPASKSASSDHTLAMMYYCLELVDSQYKNKAFEKIWNRRSQTWDPAEIRYQFIGFGN